MMTMTRAETRKLHERARNITFYAIRNGELVREPCERCGDEKSEAHHEDYNNPLEVMWLCNHHHHERHAELRKERSVRRQRERQCRA